MSHVFVKFYQDDGSPSNDIFVFRSHVTYLQGTCVIVQAQKTIKAAIVCEPPAEHTVRKLTPNKDVLAVVTEWYDDRKFLDGLLGAEMVRELDAAVKKLPREALYELAASLDSRIKKLYARFKGVPEEKPAEEPTVSIKLSKDEVVSLGVTLQVTAKKMPWGSTGAIRVQELDNRLEHADLNPFVMRLSDAEELAGWLKLSRDSKLPITPVEDRLLTAIMRVRNAGMFDGDAKRIRNEEKVTCYPVLPGDAPEYLKVAICPGCGRAGCDGACKAADGGKPMPYNTDWISENEFVEFSCCRTSKDFLRKVFLENWEEGVRQQSEACRVDFYSGQKLMRLYRVPGEQRTRIPMFVDVGDAPTKAKPKDVIKVERQPIPTTPCTLGSLSAGKVRLDGDIECVRPEDQDGLSASELIGGEH